MAYNYIIIIFRKEIKAMGKKLSFDLSDENAEILESIKSEQRTPFGQTINSLIGLFCKIPPDVNTELLDFCKERIKELYEEMDRAGEYEAQTLMNKSQTYQSLAMFLNRGRRISLDSIESKPKMQKIEMLNGILICPNDYIILNKEDAQYCEYASVVEVRNAKFGVPHFLYFNSKEVNAYTDSDCKIIEELCIKEWPRFQEIINSLVEPIPDPSAEHKWQYLNAHEVNEAPQIGHFGVYVQGDSRYPSSYKPPMGTRIIKI